MGFKPGKAFYEISDESQEIYFCFGYHVRKSCLDGSFGSCSMRKWIDFLYDDEHEPWEHLFTVYVLLETFGQYCEKHVYKEILRKEIGERYLTYELTETMLNSFKIGSNFLPMPTSTMLGMSMGPLGAIIGFALDTVLVSAAQPRDKEKIEQAIREFSSNIKPIAKGWERNCKANFSDAKDAYWALKQDGIL